MVPCIVRIGTRDLFTSTCPTLRFIVLNPRSIHLPLHSHQSSVIRHPNATMKLSNAAAVFLFSGPSRAFVVSPLTYKVGSSSSRVEAEIRPKSEKNEVLEFGWDGTTALGGAAVDSKPARMLDAIRESGEVQSSACELFNLVRF